MRVLSTGSRSHRLARKVFDALDAVHEGERGPITLLVEGASDLNADGSSVRTGWDYWSHIWARTHRGVIPVRMPAVWETYDKPAGPIRNGWMLDVIKPELVVAGPGGDGTANMKNKARAAGIEVFEVE